MECMIRCSALRWYAATAFVASVAACSPAAAPGPAFGPALTLAEEGGTNPTVAVDPVAGGVVLAWVGESDGRADVYFARIPAGGEAGSPVRVNDVPGDAAPHEQAPAQGGGGPEGNIYVVWQNNTPIEGRRFPASDLRFARSTDGGRTFEPAITVNDDAGGLPASHTFHDLAVAADGTIYISWIDSRERARMEAEANGSAGDGLPGPEIRIARSDDGGRSFGPSVVVDRDSCPCCRTALAVGPDGAVYVAWRKVHEGNVRDIVVARSEDGGRTFGPPVRVHADDWVLDGCPHAGPSIDVDAAGRLHVAWYTGREGRQGVYYAVSEDGGRSFGPPVALVEGEWVPISLVRLAVDPRGGVWFAWDDRRGETRTVQLAYAAEGGRPRPVDAVPVPGGAPVVAVQGNTRVVAWLDGESIRARTAFGDAP
mgnify:CR=1 FL=1